ncbi:PqqD family protein [Calidifontibacter terrae]
MSYALSVRGGIVFAMTETALLIWRAAEGMSDATSVAAGLAGQYGWDQAEILDEVTAFLAQLVEAGLLERSGVSE